MPLETHPVAQPRWKLRAKQAQMPKSTRALLRRRQASTSIRPRISRCSAWQKWVQ